MVRGEDAGAEHPDASRVVSKNKKMNGNEIFGICATRQCFFLDISWSGDRELLEMQKRMTLLIYFGHEIFGINDIALTLHSIYYTVFNGCGFGGIGSRRR